MSRTFKEQVELIEKQRKRRAERVKEFEENKAVIEDGKYNEPEQDETTSPKNTDRSSKPAE